MLLRLLGGRSAAAIPSCGVRSCSTPLHCHSQEAIKSNLKSGYPYRSSSSKNIYAQAGKFT
jgi:hypothetical protein